jgi:colanic acid biosynthesis glycosyl transferase WcaI
LRLLVVSQYFWPEDFRINELVSELSGRGHMVTVLTGKPNYPSGVVFPEFAADPARFSSYAGARIIRASMLPRGQGKLRLLLNYVSFAIGATIAGWLALRDEQFDAIFVFEPSPVTVGLPALALRATRGWPVAFWVLDQWPDSLRAVGVVRSARLLSLVGMLVRAIYSRCDVILSPSRLLLPQISKYAGPRQRVEYFPNWAEAGYAAASVNAAPEVPLAPGVFSVMFAGNIGEAQDFPAILDAAERLAARADIRWLVVGDGRVAPWVRAEIIRRGLEERVLMLGRYPSERMPSFFQHADALLVSLKPEPIFAMTSPGKIQSYLAFGRPVLAMLDGEGATVIEEAGAGLTSAAGNGERLADNVVRLAAMSSTARTAMGHAGAAHAAREFARPVLVDRLEGWLHDMINSTHARGPS